VVAEHRLADVVSDATRMIVLAHGQIVADGQPESVLSHDLAGWGLDAPVTIEPVRSSASDVVNPLSGKVEAGPEPDAIEGWPSMAHRTRDAEPVVEWDDVWFDRGGHPVLRGVNLAAEAGDLVALLGPNGAGKTTLLHHANGLLRPRQGTVRVLGRPVGRRPVSELAGTVGLVVQQPERMFFAPTVREEIAAGPRALGRVDQAWSAQLVERLGLTPLLDRVPQRLSAGEQRRVALASVLAARPRALVLDEPTAGQDAAGRRSLETLLRDATATGTAVVLATHDTDWALSLCPWWAVLAEGRIVAGGTPAVVCARPEILALAHLRLPRVMRLHGIDEMPGGSHVLRP
jgi:energy-coupling factor transporter ATP-binding protein EcfA2